MKNVIHESGLIHKHQSKIPSSARIERLLQKKAKKKVKKLKKCLVF